MPDRPDDPDHPDDLCPRPDRLDQPAAQLPAAQLPAAQLPASQPLAPPLYLTSVWQCESTQQAERLLTGELDGFVYQREDHPNARMFADKCARLHGAQRAVATASGMAALAAVLLSQLEAGDHLVLNHQLYGRSLTLMGRELGRLGIDCTLVDTCDLRATADAMNERTRLVVTETIANPMLQVADVAALAEIAHRAGSRLLIDNTFATPILCRPLSLGADLVMESVSKMMNGHSDTMLGAVCGTAAAWDRVPEVVSTWGLTSSPMDCYLAARGLATLHLRMERACENARRAAEFLAARREVARVAYPGLPDHPHHGLAREQFGGRFGSIATMTLPGGRPAADAFIAAARRIPFCPSLGEACTTLSHPQSTSHRALSEERRAALGIDGGTIRLSLGCESSAYVIDALAEALAAVEGP